MLGVENVACRRGDFLDCIDALRQIFNHDLAFGIGQILADCIVLRPCDFEFCFFQRLFGMAVNFLYLQHRIFRVTEHKRFRLAPFQRDVLVAVRVNAIALRRFDFLHCINSFVQIAD